MDDHIVRLSNDGRFRDSVWHMTIDLKEVAASAGKRERDGYNGGSYVIYKIPTAKRLLKLIREYGTDRDFLACDKYLAKNEKLAEYWKTLIG